MQETSGPTVKRDSVAMMRLAATVAIVVFALLLLAGDEGVLPYALEIVGLLFTAAALMAASSFQAGWRASHPIVDGGPVDITGLVPVLVDIGLWSLAAVYVVTLLEIARG